MRSAFVMSYHFASLDHRPPGPGRRDILPAPRPHEGLSRALREAFAPRQGEVDEELARLLERLH